ncbi:hemerythrin domain-containing protein [Micrococcales bacterium 31B]|nr:hemerythrin domain-containing protein [Micrococcales bacterium 31B]
MTDRDAARAVAWAVELRAVHAKLREALRVTRESGGGGEPAEAATRDLLLFCHGFCAALTGHHEGEDRVLFPALAAAHPELQGSLAALRRDHSMIAHLIGALDAAVRAEASPEDLRRHLDGVAAIMESHFRYEERVLGAVLETLRLDADPARVLGPL